MGVVPGRSTWSLAGMKERFRPGNKVWVASDSYCSSFSAVFEDDGETGYFYAYDRDRSDKPILDAVHVYDVDHVAARDRKSDCEAEIFWSTDGMKAGLLINDYLHAIIDFGARRAYCRSNYPPPGGHWTSPQREPWRDELAKLLD